MAVELAGGAGRISAELRGILLALAAMLMFGLMDAASKYLSTRYPTPQIIWLRYVFTIPMALLVLRARTASAPAALRQAVAAGAPLAACSCSRSAWWSGASARMPLADVHALLALTPLAVTALCGAVARRAGRPAALGGGRRGLHRRPDHPPARASA